jgi:D-beta-D-heptose 7-phosphate kinase/D-beta-D-heptose 1-phosphate adenosyltransferase
MKVESFIRSKIVDAVSIQRLVNQRRVLGRKIVFTNGVFDIFHAGHIESLSSAANEGDYLIVGLNSDLSVKRLKGDSRPINDEQSRALLLASLLMVDAVVIFSEDTPLELIKLIGPDVLVKGGDYTVEQIAGSKEVIAAGGRVVINKIKEGFSSTSILNRLGNEE